MKSDSSSQDLETTTNDDPNIPITFYKIPDSIGEVIPEVDENEKNEEVQITNQTPLMRQLSYGYKNQSISSSYLNQIKHKKNSIGSITEMRKETNKLLNSSSKKVYGNDLSVEKEKGEVSILNKTK